MVPVPLQLYRTGILEPGTNGAVMAIIRNLPATTFPAGAASVNSASQTAITLPFAAGRIWTTPGDDAPNLGTSKSHGLRHRTGKHHIQGGQRVNIVERATDADTSQVRSERRGGASIQV